MNKTIVEKELKILFKKRKAYLKQYEEKKELTPGLASKIPPNLKSTLNSAFCKSFELIYKNGTPLIDKTYNKKDAENNFQINQFANKLHQNKKSLNSFSKQSDKSNAINLMITGIEGIGLGIIGCGIPDIPIFTSVILRSLYEVSANYGYDYTQPEEQLYQLLIIQGAMSYGDDLKKCLELLDTYNNTIAIPTEEMLKEQIKESASALANEMLFLKFVQGIPIVGIVGGMSNSIFLHRIQRFAKLNYQLRMLRKFYI